MLDSKKNYINSSVASKNITDVSSVLPLVAKDNGSIVEIEYISAVTDEIKSKIKNCFSTEYKFIEDGYILEATDTKINIYAENDRGSVFG